MPFTGSSLGKKQQVAEMFNRIAGRYDFMNRFLSGGIDSWWRKKAVKELADLHPQHILDVATGTGDVALLMNRYLQPEKITGIDISEKMLELGRRKIEQSGLSAKIFLQTGDSESIPFPDNQFDAVTVAFGVRNFENLEKGLAEMNRVLRPGGKLVVLEFSKPKKGFRTFYHIYLRMIAPRIAALVSRNRKAYEYLNESVLAFPEGQDFLQIMQKKGFIGVYLKTLSFCICTIYVGKKPVDG